MRNKFNLLTTRERLEIYKLARTRRPNYMCTRIEQAFRNLNLNLFEVAGNGVEYEDYMPELFPEFWEIRPAGITKEHIERFGTAWFPPPRELNNLLPDEEASWMKYDFRLQFFDTIIARTEYKLAKENQTK